MSIDRDDSMKKAQRLADYSDAIKGGEPTDAHKIDPMDAAIIWQLNALGTAKAPSAEFFARSQRRPELSIESGSQNQPAFEPLHRSMTVIDLAKENGDLQHSAAIAYGDHSKTFRTTQPITRVALPRHIPLRARIPKFPIAAVLVVLIGMVSVMILASSGGGKNGSPSGLETSQPIGRAQPQSKAFRLQPETGDPTLFGVVYPGVELYLADIVTVPWDGTGTVLLSSCPDSACNLVLNAQMQILVTNSEGSETLVVVSDNSFKDGIRSALPVVLSDVFSTGSNKVQAVLSSNDANLPETMAPVYIVLLE
jgi:hypothetical protein